MFSRKNFCAEPADNFVSSVRSSPPRHGPRPEGRKKRRRRFLATAREVLRGWRRGVRQNLSLTPPWILQRVSPLLTVISELAGSATLLNESAVKVGLIWPVAL